MLLHIAALVREIDPSVDERIVAAPQRAIAPAVLHRMRTQLDVERPRSKPPRQRSCQG